MLYAGFRLEKIDYRALILGVAAVEPALVSGGQLAPDRVVAHLLDSRVEVFGARVREATEEYEYARVDRQQLFVVPLGEHAVNVVRKGVVAAEVPVLFLAVPRSERIGVEGLIFEIRVDREEADRGAVVLRREAGLQVRRDVEKYQSPFEETVIASLWNNPAASELTGVQNDRSRSPADLLRRVFRGDSV